MIVATVHGWVAAWLAIRMLFRPRKRIKLWGFTVWPQGMIPRHRERLAQTIGNAVGKELVSQETVLKALFETNFFSRKIEGFVASYTQEILDTSYPSLIDVLPARAREPVLDAISALQYKIAAHIADLLRSEETAEAVQAFVDRRVTDLLSQRLSETLDEEAFQNILRFVEERFHGIVNEPDFEQRVRVFVGARLDEMAHSQARLNEMFKPHTIEILKERLDSQIPPIVEHLTELATNQKTRKQMGALIKREVNDYYSALPFFKKIFVSRYRIHEEVDDLVNKTLPRRVQEYLRGEAFEREAENFLDSSIDNLFARPINEIVGQLAPDKLDMIKDEVSGRLLVLARSPELAMTLVSYTNEALERLRPHTLGALLEHSTPDSSERLKKFLARGLLSIISSEDTILVVNNILATQIERLLVAPIGKLSDFVSENAVRGASAALTEGITNAARERLPLVIEEFDIGGIVRQKISDYPPEKLEALVLSVAHQHLRTIELFGAVIGLFIGIFQAIYFWYFSTKVY